MSNFWDHMKLQMDRHLLLSGYGQKVPSDSSSQLWIDIQPFTLWYNGVRIILVFSSITCQCPHIY